jgi:excisionase family DNA binding protein
MGDILPQKNHFRVDEAALYCEVSRQTIYRWVECGLLDAVRIGKKRLKITRKSLLKIIEPV